MNEIPNECLYIKECKELVTRELYQVVCSSKAWIYCPRVPEEIVEKYKKHPIEWKKIEGEGE